MSVQHLHSPFTVCEMTMQHLHGLFTVCETIMQPLHSLAAVCAPPYMYPAKFAGVRRRPA